MLLPITLTAANYYKVNKSSCSYIDSEISNTKEDMRVDYNEKKGERLREKLRLLKKQSRACKKQKFPTSR